MDGITNALISVNVECGTLLNRGYAVDKTAKTNNPKGKEYCDTPGTSCWYNEKDICVNCGRKKGWRRAKDRT